MSWYGLGIVLGDSRAIREHVAAQLARAAKRLNVQPPPLIEDQIFTVNASSNGKVIRFNPVWVSRIVYRHCDNRVCGTAIVLWVLSHELAHHVQQHSILFWEDRHRQELEADAIAARIMARENINPKHLVSVLLEFGIHSTATHPGANDRWRVIVDAFNDECRKMAVEINQQTQRQKVRSLVKMTAAVIQDFGRNYLVVVVRRGVVTFRARADEVRNALSAKFNTPVILMEEGTFGRTQFYGDLNVVHRVARADWRQFPWREYWVQ